MKILSEKRYKELINKEEQVDFLKDKYKFYTHRFNAIVNSPCIDLERAIVAIMTCMKMSDIELEDRELYYGPPNNIEVTRTPYNTTRIRIQRKTEHQIAEELERQFQTELKEYNRIKDSLIFIE